jgi:hypothetical protein
VIVGLNFAIANARSAFGKPAGVFVFWSRGHNRQSERSKGVTPHIPSHLCGSNSEERFLGMASYGCLAARRLFWLHVRGGTHWGQSAAATANIAAENDPQRTVPKVPIGTR